MGLGPKVLYRRGETVQLFCGDWIPLLATVVGKKVCVPQLPRAGAAPNFWAERTMFVPEIRLGPSLCCSSLLQVRGGGCLCGRGPPWTPARHAGPQGPSPSVIQCQLQEGRGQPDFPTMPVTSGGPQALWKLEEPGPSSPET